MIHPQGIDIAQQHHPLDLLEGFAEELALGLIAGFRFLQQGLGDIVTAHAAELLQRVAQVVLIGDPAHEAIPQAIEIPFLVVLFIHQVLLHAGGDVFLHHLADAVGDRFAIQHAAALGVDDLPLAVHDIIVLEDILTHLEVHPLDAGLRRLNGIGEELGLDGHIFIDAHAVHQCLQALAAEQTHEVILQRDDELGGTGVALTAGTAAQLVIDAAAFVPLGAQDIQAADGTDLFGFGGDFGLVLLQQLLEVAAGGKDLLILRFAVGGGLVDEVLLHALPAEGILGEIFGVAAQHDIGTAAGHIGGDGDGAGLTGLGDDLGFLFVELGVEDLVGNAAGLEQLADHLGFFDGGGADQDGLAAAVALGDDIQDGGVLALLGLVDGIGEIDTGERLIGGQLHDIQPVDIPELLLLGHGGTGHTGQLIVHAEVVLEGDGGQSAVLPRDGDALFGLDGLVQAIGIAAADHEAAGELIDDDDLAVLHDIVDIPLHDAAGGDARLCVG